MSHPVCYTRRVKNKKPVKARVSPEGLMGSKTRIEKPKKGKGSFRRRPKYQ